jgi:hypothetical protein
MCTNLRHAKTTWTAHDRCVGNLAPARSPVRRASCPGLLAALAGADPGQGRREDTHNMRPPCSTAAAGRARGRGEERRRRGRGGNAPTCRRQSRQGRAGASSSAWWRFLAFELGSSPGHGVTVTGKNSRLSRQFFVPTGRRAVYRGGWALWHTGRAAERY